MKRKVCFVIQRYGLDVNGGAELHCRQLAEHLGENYEVTVMTTKAKDYITWRNEYVQEIERINGITVYRFDVEKERDMEKFLDMNRLFEKKILGREKKEMEFLKAQGPYCPKLIYEIKRRKEDFDIFIFFTYLYYTTICGIREVYGKSILIPTAHDEPYVKMALLRDVFKKAGAIYYNTELEREMVEHIHNNESVLNAIGGVGITIPAQINRHSFKERYGLEDYIIYVGRIEAGKRCRELFKAFGQYKRDYRSNLKLVLVGKASLDIPKTSDIISLGFISDDEKFQAIAGAMALVLPSQYESLSMVVLEAMKLQVPVVVYGKCAVTKAHCLKGNAGLYYDDYLEFEECLEYLRNHPQIRREMGKNGKEYVDRNYTWDVICNKLENLIDLICENNT